MHALVHTRDWRGWTLYECAELGSTNDFARKLGPWEAIRARRQTDARGRHGRAWASGEGGLWFSAVLPLEPQNAGWNAFPLVAGLAVVSMLRGLGLPAARLRWPNDVLVDGRKICGILMEKFHADRVVVGIGLNVANDPAAENAALATIATSIARELPLSPAPDELYEELLIGLRVLHGRVAEEGFAALSPEINNHWGDLREVELTTARGSVRGRFLGVDGKGDLIMEKAGTTETHAAPYVQLLREV